MIHNNRSVKTINTENAELIKWRGQIKTKLDQINHIRSDQVRVENNKSLEKKKIKKIRMKKQK